MLVEGVHAGIAGGGLEHGYLMGRSEQLIGHFQAADPRGPRRLGLFAAPR